MSAFRKFNRLMKEQRRKEKDKHLARLRKRIIKPIPPVNTEQHKAWVVKEDWDNATPQG